MSFPSQDLSITEENVAGTHIALDRQGRKWLDNNSVKMLLDLSKLKRQK